MLVKIQHFPFTSSLFEPTSNFDRDVDEALNNFWRGSAVGSTHRYPSVDIAEYENESVVVAELPGVKKEDLKLSIHEGVLTISGVRKALQVPENSTWIRNEITTGEFSRAIKLPHDVKMDAISAELVNGVLRVVLPKSEAVRPRDISIK